jgi:anti-anti-sigma factor
LLPSSSPHPPITRRENAAPDDARAERPLLLDLSEAPHHALAAGVRDGWPDPRNGAARIVIDLGERRTLPHDAIEELLVTHRALRRAGGKCALVVGPALAAQLSLAYPDGILWAADRHVAIVALAPRQAPFAAAVTLRPRRRRLHVELSGELDLASLPALEAVLARANAAARERREIVFDLTDLAFVDLVALRAITTAVVRCDLAGARTRVTGAQTQVRRLVRHLNWQEQLPGIDDAPLRARVSNETPS